MLTITFLTGCVSVQIPPEQINQKTFTQESEKSYKDAYRIIAKQVRACYALMGPFGGYQVQADLDTVTKSGTVELYKVGIKGAQKPEDSTVYRMVTINDAPNGSLISVTGTTPKVVYLTHRTIPNWLKGNESCGIEKN